MPSHTHTFTGSSATTNSTGAHTHTRGDMEITGAIMCYSTYNKGNEDYWTNGVNGAFYKNANDYVEEASSTNQSSSATADACRKVSFSAARSWTGSTSSNGAHTHTLTAAGSNSNTGGG